MRGAIGEKAREKGNRGREKVGDWEGGEDLLFATSLHKRLHGVECMRLTA